MRTTTAVTVLALVLGSAAVDVRSAPSAGSSDAAVPYVTETISTYRHDSHQMTGTEIGIDYELRDPRANDFVCPTDSSDHQVWPVYVYSGESNFDVHRDWIEQSMASMQSYFDVSSMIHGADRSLVPRVRSTGTGSNCRPLVIEQEIPQSVMDTDDHYDDWVATYEAGLDDPNALHLLFLDRPPVADDPTRCGLAMSTPDDDPDPDRNRNTIGPRIATVWSNCFGWRNYGSPTGDVSAHEVLHSIGAVQSSAPNYSAGGHCSGTDLMCVNYGEEPAQVCDGDDSVSIDCNRDDYFDPTGSPRGYLANHWNTADSPWLMEAPLASTLQARVYDEVPLVDLGSLCSGVVPGGGFDDVPEGGVFGVNVGCLVRDGITEGFADGTFRPGATLTRGQTAAFLRRTWQEACDRGWCSEWTPSDMGAPADAFPDDDGTFFENDFDVLASADIELSNDRLARPGEAITRGEMAYGLFGLRLAIGGGIGHLRDWFGDLYDHPYEDPILVATAAGMIAGDGNGRFRPDARLTRGEMTAFLTRALASARDAAADA